MLEAVVFVLLGWTDTSMLTTRPCEPSTIGSAVRADFDGVIDSRGFSTGGTLRTSIRVDEGTAVASLSDLRNGPPRLTCSYTFKCAVDGEPDLRRTHCDGQGSFQLIETK